VRLARRFSSRVAQVTINQPSREPEPRRRNHRVLAGALVALGALCILISTVSVWVRDVALDPDVWSDTSSQLLESENVRDVLGVYIVDQAYSATDAQARLEEALPVNLKPLAGAIASQVRSAAYQTASRALARPRVQELWRSTNRAVNAQLVALLEGNTERLQVSGNAVVLNLDQIVADVAGQVGLGSSATEAIQSRVEPIVVLRSDQLTTAQRVVKALKALSFWPLIFGLLCWGGAVYLAGSRRRETLRNIAISLAAIGLLLLVIIRVVGNGVVDSLVKAESVKPAVHDVWTVLTALLAESAEAGIAVGLIALLGAWFAGPGARATSGRRWLAPTFRDRPLLVHGALAAALLLFLLWGPAGTPRRLITLVIVAILAFVGLELLRRQTVREFPDAQPARHRPLARLGAVRRGEQQRPAERLESLERLAALHERGALSDDEYEAEKALLTV
jgi:putative oligomerization/nucleic acid binding protein